ncbi:hypothetical protein [Shimia gijangensis]|uniref:hypothetical protein n=1 Tax=Shimia gijangensis TaxID=1470563 RepID=UPI001114BDDA|nr:hypothetical protein [Shimia gijangensis]
MPIAIRAFSQLSGMRSPRFFAGPKPKFMINKTSDVKQMLLFRVKKDRSFHGTGPNMWYRKIEYPKQNAIVHRTNAIVELFLVSVVSFIAHSLFSLYDATKIVANCQSLLPNKSYSVLWLFDTFDAWIDRSDPILGAIRKGTTELFPSLSR